MAAFVSRRNARRFGSLNDANVMEARNRADFAEAGVAGQAVNLWLTMRREGPRAAKGVAA
jgi:hypothetical protein